MDTFIVLAASYETLGAAEADFHAVRDFYLTSGLLGTYDAAVITRDDAGKVQIVVKHEPPARQGAWGGLGIGLAGGALVALFPAVGIGAGLLLGAGGAAVGTLAGHVSAGLSRADLKDLGELLDQGRSGLVVVAASDLGDRVEHVVRRASKLAKKPLAADQRAVGQDIEAAALRRDLQYRQAEAESAAAVAEGEARAAEQAAEQYSSSGPRRSGGDLASQLDDLARLRQAGVLSAAEFEAAKTSLIGGPPG
jgi:uncharacterized membrane protein